MFRKSSPQTNLFEPAYGLPPAKQARLTQTWAWHFRERCLPRIDEGAFADIYCANNGRPNAPIRVLVGLLILKEVFDYTDDEALEAAAFDLRWQTALGLTWDDPVPCQKTLHNFRRRLAEHDRAEALFLQLTDVLRLLLGIETARQRLDSTQICSNIKLLSRLSRFCETHRLLLHRLARHAPALLERITPAVRQRYVRADGTDSSYEDARSTEGRRRLAVCARDAWRLVEALRGMELPEPVQDAYALVCRLYTEQCLVLEAPAMPQPDDADAAEPRVPVRLREKGEVAAGGLQTPHDPDATYGTKGVGYTVTICETVGNGEKPELLTHLAVTEAYAADQHQTVPTVEALQERQQQPTELLADASFGSTTNLLDCQEQGTTLVAPVPGGATPSPEHPQIYVACLPGVTESACSLGVVAASTVRRQRKTRVWYTVTFAAAACAGCPHGTVCPAVRQTDGRRVLQIRELEAINTLRRWQETTPTFRERYRWRSGIEGTNSETKRAHGLGTLRVRGKARVRVAVYLKGLACNVKRALHYWVDQVRKATAPAAEVRCTALRRVGERPWLLHRVLQARGGLPWAYRRLTAGRAA